MDALLYLLLDYSCLLRWYIPVFVPIFDISCESFIWGVRHGVLTSECLGVFLSSLYIIYIPRFISVFDIFQFLALFLLLSIYIIFFININIITIIISIAYKKDLNFLSLFTISLDYYWIVLKNKVGDPALIIPKKSICPVRCNTLNKADFNLKPGRQQFAKINSDWQSR